MNKYKKEYISYRIVRAKESLRDAKLLAKNARWNACVNRLYYACFYMVSALLITHNLNSKSHSGTNVQLGLHFVKTGKLSLQHGKLFSDLMDARQKGDYGDKFDFDKKTVEALIKPVENFLDDIELLIK